MPNKERSDRRCFHLARVSIHDNFVENIDAKNLKNRKAVSLDELDNFVEIAYNYVEK